MIKFLLLLNFWGWYWSRWQWTFTNLFLIQSLRFILTWREFIFSGLGGSKYISFEERQWHNDCFNCKKCSVSLVGRGFLTERDDILCPECGKDIWFKIPSKGQESSSDRLQILIQIQIQVQGTSNDYYLGKDI